MCGVCCVAQRPWDNPQHGPLVSKTGLDLPKSFDLGRFFPTNYTACFSDVFWTCAAQALELVALKLFVSKMF